MKLYEKPETARKTAAYFSASHGGIEHSIAREPKLFFNSLVYNLLFEEGGLVIPDIFFFNCEPLIRHVASAGGKKWPLLGRAIGEGLSIPAFRLPKIETFNTALTEIGVNKILGMEFEQYTKYSTTPRAFAGILDSFASGSRAQYMTWPEDMGSRFASFVRRVFENPLADSATEKHIDMSNALEGWRDTCLIEAQRLTAAKGGTGIRRAEIWNALGALRV